MSAIASTSITQGSIARATLSLAWPVVLSMALHTAFHLADMAWVGRLGPAPLAAITTAFFASWVLFALADLVGIGVSAHVARRIGEGRPLAAGEAAAQALGMAIGVALLLALLGISGAPALFRLLGTAPEVAWRGARYVQITFGASLFALIAFTCEAILRSSGDTRTPMKIMAGAVVFNMLLDPLFILGPGPFPRWGLSGAALATILAQLIAAVLLVRVLYRRRESLPIPWRRIMRPSPPLLASMARIGTPPAVSSLLFSVVYLFLSNVMARFGTIALAALGIGNRLESISYLTAGGFGVAASTLVGQNLGAALPRRAERAAWTATAIIVVLTGIYSVLLFCFAEGFVRVFTSDPRVIVEAARFVRILSFCQAFMGVEIVLQGAFGGAGDTLPPTLISVPISLLRIPLAYLLALPLGFGPGAIWWLLSVSCLIRGLLLGLWFRRNRWMQKTLPAH